MIDKITKSIASTWAAAVSLAGAFCLGAGLVFVFGGFYQLPAQMQIMDERVQQLERIVNRLDILVCVITNEHIEGRETSDCVSVGPGRQVP
jgi:hypothetical protein